MNEFTCAHCGKTIPDSCTRCPGCGAGIGKQPTPIHNTAQKRFLIFFIILTIFCFVLAVWLPR